MHCKANGLRIIGYYEASERLEDVALSLVGQKIASQIHHVNPEAFAVVVSYCIIPTEQTLVSNWT